MAGRWVQPLAVTVLVMTFAYVVFGVPGTDNTDTVQTDRVSPLNSWIWLGLLTAAMPILKARWRDVAALLLGAWPLLLLYGYFALSVEWALDPGAALRRILFTCVQLIQFAILLTGIRRAPLVHIVIATVCALAAYADVIDWVVAPGTAMGDEGFGGLQGQKNQAGLLMMYGCLSATLCIFIVQRWRWKAFYAVSTLVMALLLAATRSTTSQSVVLSAAVVMPVIIVIAHLPRRFIVAIAAVSVLGLTAAALGYLAWCGITGLDPTLPLRGATFTARTDIWFFVIDEIHKRPWLGAGYSSFWSVDPAVQPSLKTDQWFSVYSIINEGHNGYLDQLATGGIVGLLGSLLVLLHTIGRAGRAIGWTLTAPLPQREALLTRPTAILHLALLLGLIVHNFTESNLFNNNSILAIGFLICVLDLQKWHAATRAAARQRQRRPMLNTSFGNRVGGLGRV